MKKFLISSFFLVLVFLTCKVVSATIIYSENDYGCGWENYASSITIENSYEIGVNLAIYAANHSSNVNIMRVIHNGDWDPDPYSINNLVDQINSRTSVMASFGGNANLGITDLSNVDMLYITGHYPFSLSNDEKTALENYLNSGGFLFADDCSNYLDNEGFETSFRNLVIEMYGSPLSILPASHDIYSSYYNLDGSDFSYSSAGNGTEWNTEPLEFHPGAAVPIPSTLLLVITGMLNMIGFKIAKKQTAI